MVDTFLYDVKRGLSEKRYFVTEQFFLISSFTLAVYLTGLIWVVQVIHYPSFHYIQDDQFTSFVSFHGARISLVVAPAMILELIFSFLWVVFALSNLAWLNLILVLCLWGVTFFISMPCHKKLHYQRNTKIIDRLIKTNWLRTIIWTFRSMLIGYYLI